MLRPATYRFSYRHAPELIDRLTRAQNHSANLNIDIMTFAGLCDSWGELLDHVERYEAIAAKAT